MHLALLAQNQHGSQGVTFKMTNGPRITPIDRQILRFSEDELPQLCCVITGDMSLVGPRSDIAIDQKMNMGMPCTQHPSIKSDLYLLAKTVAAILGRKRAY